MNRSSRPSPYQMLVLYEAREGLIHRDGDKYKVTGSHRDHNVTLQVRRLCHLGLLQAPTDMEGDFFVTLDGLALLMRTNLHEIIMRLEQAS